MGAGRLARNLLLWHGLRALRRRFGVVPIHDFRMILDLSDQGLSRQLFIWRDRERVLGHILRKIVKPGMRILDVGGNIGYYPLMECRLVGKEGTVYVLEPFPPNFELLNRNLELNGCQDRVSTHMVAASDKPGRERFYTSFASNLGTMFPDTSDTGIARDLTGEHIDVATVDLSSFIHPLEKIDLIRMDTEGAEVPILRGLLPAIRAGHFDGRLVIEIHASRYSETNDMAAVLGELFCVGYYPEAATSEDESFSAIRDRGYRPQEIIRESNKVWRGIYSGLKEQDLIDAIGQIGAIRDLVLAKRT